MNTNKSLPTEVLIAPAVFLYAGLHFEDTGIYFLVGGIILMAIGILKSNTE